MKIELPDHFKIGIVGSKKVGKTTLANLLVGYLKSIGNDTDLVDEVAKRCPLPINKDTSIEASLWILGNQIASEMMMADKAIIVCDRTAIDVYPFAKLSNLNRANELEMLKKTVVSYITLKPYNVLFYVLPQDGFGEDDSLSFENKYQQELDSEFRHLLRNLSLNVVEVQGNDSNVRLNEIIKWLEDYSNG
jgi:GTPase SAR1 family protein